MTAAPPDVVLSVRNLSKLFRVYRSPRDLLKETLTGRPCHEEHWALKDISFDLRRGEVMGIVGSNGAGKSTLLKLIAGTLDKTTGEIEVNGNISAILELGTTFNREYSGRENVEMALVYAKVPEDKMAEKMREVIEFSELEAVIDHPFRTYSSGMQTRLTFSTAIATATDLIMVDEALAAGDARFVNKALRHLEKVCRQDHVSAILVSHSMASLIRLCDRGLYLREGRVEKAGTIQDVAKMYETIMLMEDEDFLFRMRDSGEGYVSGDGSVRLKGVRFFENDQAAEILHVGENCAIVVDLISNRAIPDVWAGLEIYNASSSMFITTVSNMNCRFGDLSRTQRIRVDIQDGEGSLIFKLDPLLLGAGSYYFHLLIHDSESWHAGKWHSSESVVHERYAGQFRVKVRDAFAFERLTTIQLPAHVRFEVSQGGT